MTTGNRLRKTLYHAMLAGAMAHSGETPCNRPALLVIRLMYSGQDSTMEQAGEPLVIEEPTVEQLKHAGNWGYLVSKSMCPFVANRAVILRGYI